MNKFGVVLGLAIGLVSFACGSDDSDPDGGSSTPVDAENFPARYAAVFCEAQSLCCTDAGGERASGCEGDVEDAVAARLSTSLANETQEFVAAHAEACLEALEGVTDCAGAWTSIISACALIVEGTVAAGEPCDGPEDCAQPDAGYSGCSELGGGTEKLCRQFQATAGAGDDCFADRSGPFAGEEGAVTICERGLSCIDGKCVAGPALGEACDDASECGQGVCIESTCQEIALGESCSQSGAPCELQANCIDGVCEQRPLLDQVAEEHACSVDP